MALAGEARRPDALEAGQLTLAADEVAAGGPSGGGGERDGRRSGRCRRSQRRGGLASSVVARRCHRCPDGGRGWRRGEERGRRGEVGIVVEDLRLQLGQLRRGVETELVGEDGPGARVDAQGVGLSPAAVEGHHQPTGEPLAQRVLVGRALELAHRLGVAAEREQRVEAGLQRLQPQLVPADGRRSGPLLVGHVGEHGTVPLRQARLEVDQRSLRIGGQRGAGGGDAVLEAGGVEPVPLDGQDVPRSLASQQQRITEGPAQQGDVALQRVDGGRRRIAGPDVVDQPIDGDDLSAHQGEPGQHGPLAGPAEGQWLAVALGGDGAEQADVERRRALPVRSHRSRRHPADSTASAGSGPSSRPVAGHPRRGRRAGRRSPVRGPG